MNLALESTQCFLTFMIHYCLLIQNPADATLAPLVKLKYSRWQPIWLPRIRTTQNTTITSLLIYLGTYFLAPIVCLVSQGIDRMCPICIQCCKSKMAAKMSAANMKHYNNHKQTHVSMAYVRKNCYTLYLYFIHEV